MIKTAFFIIFIFFLSGCATFYRGAAGTVQEIAVRTEPPGANVICGNQAFISPGMLQLARSASHQITISKEGYKTVYINVSSKMTSGALAGSFLSNTAAWGWWSFGVGTALGMITDATSGSLRDVKIAGFYLPLTAGKGEITIDAAELSKVRASPPAETDKSASPQPTVAREDAVVEVKKAPEPQLPTSSEAATVEVKKTAEARPVVSSYAEYNRFLFKTISQAVVRPAVSGSGVVNVVMTLLPDGSIDDVQILESSSGDPVFREAVLNAIKSSVPYPAFPPDIEKEGKRTFTMSIDFKFKSGN